MHLLERVLVMSIENVRKKSASSNWIAQFGLPRVLRAVRFILDKHPSIFAENGLPFGESWPILEEGNGKLPFLCYSEFPMATCPGAGACSFYVTGKRGWCYSQGAFRYPAAVARLLLNTLANVADQAFAHPAPNVVQTNPGPERKWQSFVADLALHLSAKQRQNRPMFLRLFVDGDFKDRDSLREWMKACRRMANPPDGAHRIEVYGYTQAWHLFRAEAQSGATWPTNYTVNLSDTCSSHWLLFKFPD
jgi:hypothetical protein